VICGTASRRPGNARAAADAPLTATAHAIADTGAGDPGAVFNAAMAALEPFEPSPRLGIAVSGGADSMALALLADAWVRRRGGSVLGLIVDHGLRPESAREASQTATRLQARGIPRRVITLRDLARGPAIAERARIARYRVLFAACAEAGILHLLTGHHAEDQIETLMIRVLGGSASAGLAAMPLVTETRTARLIRPLLGVPPSQLRRFLIAERLDWAEDPSNRDPRALRTRLRLGGGTRTPEATAALLSAIEEAGRQRAIAEASSSTALAAGVAIRPEGFAVLAGTPLPPEALAALVRVIGGGHYATGTGQIAALASRPAAGTIAGVRLLPAGRLGPGWLLVREAAAMAPQVPAEPGAVWDNRFRLSARAVPGPGAMLGPLGDDAARFRRQSSLPAAILRTLPAVRRGNVLVSVPHLSYPDSVACGGTPVLFAPVQPVSGAAFAPAGPKYQ
jgi:tRNA(Ile)-lysidine synthase